jgi:UDP-glucose:(heptosyl)LPS alpha-1,3-glucosyltransferase
VGLGFSDSRGCQLLKLARRFNVDDRVMLLGFEEDLPALLAAADLLIHPARREAAGAVILEAFVNGLPTVVTASCGYASHVREANAGLIIPELFKHEALLAALAEAGDRTRSTFWSENGIRYGKPLELYSGLQTAANLILSTAMHNRSAAPSSIS